ncbi:hypothetical protein ONZ45_g4660 [Pleurotus djamor]|nr:hypothetical protein ONZ45_g4660 [Pleurotus djamor]
MRRGIIHGVPYLIDEPSAPPVEAPKAPPSGGLSDFMGGLGSNFMQIFGFSSVLAATGLGGNAHFADTWKVLLLGSLIEAGRRFFSWAVERLSFKYSVTARFAEGDPAYEWIILFLTEKKVWHRSRDFWVNSKTSARKWGIAPGQEAQQPSKETEEELTDYVPIYEIPQLFKWKGYWLEIHRQTGASQFNPRTNAYSNGAAALHLTIYSYNMSILKSIVDEARQRYIEVSKPNVIIHSSDTTGNRGVAFTWSKTKSKVRRPLDSVILPQGELQSLVTDAQDFLNSEDWYIEAGIPYRRGYLLYGPPGTGKSSTIYALAGELGLEIYTISLASDYIDDTMLQTAVASIPKRSIFLIEDIDCAFPSREDEEENPLMSFQMASPYAMGPPFVQPRRSAVTMSGLLNLIDGVDSEEGKFFIATTNYVDRLDAALLRPGRIDKRIRYNLADAQQVRSLFLRFFPASRFGTASQKSSFDLSALVEEFCASIPPEEFSVAELQGYLLAHKKIAHGRC